MDEAALVAELVKQSQAGDGQAAAKLFARYAQRLTRLAEQHLSRAMAGRLDGEDVVQSVFRTFFSRCARGEFEIDSSAQLWRLLVKITLAKARTQARRQTAGLRDVGAEVALIGDAALPEALAREPDPAEAAALVDEISRLLQGLPALHCHVLEMRLAGRPVAEIAGRHGVARQTIYRVLNLLKHRLSRP